MLEWHTNREESDSRWQILVAPNLLEALEKILWIAPPPRKSQIANIAEAAIAKAKCLDEENIMICPMMSTPGNTTACSKDKCAWWVEHYDERLSQCAMTAIAHELRVQTNYGTE